MKKRTKTGFTLIEVAIAVMLIVLVGTSAIASLRVGMKTMGSTQASAVAATAIREFREYTFQFTIEEIDALNGTNQVPVLGDGSPMPNVNGMQLQLSVIAVDDYDPSITASNSDSRTRVVSIAAIQDEIQLLEAVWLVAEH